MPTRKKSTEIGIGKWPFSRQNSCKLPFLLLLQTTLFLVLVAVIVVADFAEIVDVQQERMRPMNGRLYANMEPCQRPTVRVLLPPILPLSSTNANVDNNNDNDGLSNISTMSTIPITHQTLATGALSTPTTQQQSLDSSAATTATATESIRTATKTTDSNSSMNLMSNSTNSTSSSTTASSSTSSSTSTTQMPAVGHFQIEIPFQQQAGAGNVTIEAECAAQGPEKPGSRSVYTLDTAKIDWTGASELLLFNDVHILAFGYPPLQPIGIA